MQWKLSVFLSIVCVSQLTCLKKSCTMSVDVVYTRCLKPSPNVTASGLTAKNIKEILVLHNTMRKKDPATKMMKLYWSKPLAKIAQKWTDQCPEDHDYIKARNVRGWESPIGQNLGWGTPNWTTLVHMWYAEKVVWESGNREHHLVGHFTQMVMDFTTLIGCGYTTCKNNGFHFVCNYAIGQPSGGYNKPYEPGKRCKHCPKTCVDGLCDCGARMCYHYGTMDSNTCKCKCHPNFYGELCELKTCNGTDANKCKQFPPPQRLYYCNHYANISPECPFMCGVCRRRITAV